MRDFIIKLNQEENVTKLISSHILGELSKIATRYGILRNGILVEERDAEQIDAACRQYLQLTVDDAKKTEEVLSEKLCVPCTVADSHTVCVYEMDFMHKGTKWAKRHCKAKMKRKDPKISEKLYATRKSSRLRDFESTRPAH